MQKNKMPGVEQCAIAECAYNANLACHAIAITIGDMNHPKCDTFFLSPKHTSVAVQAGVGACKVSACTHNKDYECAAPSIRVGSEKNQGKCLTFEMS